MDAPGLRQDPACLSLSPLRALPAARLDSARGSWWRDRLADSLRNHLTGTNWVLASAGLCPEALPVLDVFQQPGDLTRDADGSLVKVRLEWRHRPGVSFAILDDPEHPDARLGLWASQIRVAADLQLGHIVVTAPRPFRISQQQGSTWKRLGETPQEWRQPPGALRLRVDDGIDSPQDIDTLLEPGQTLRLAIQPRPPLQSSRKPRVSRLELSLWGASALCLAGGLWYSLEMESAYSRYSRLDASNQPDEFGDRWAEVRQANLLRNILLGGAGAFLAGALYIHF